MKRLLVVSSDGHSGCADLRGYSPYLESRFRDDYEDYVAQARAFDEQAGSTTTGGGAGARGNEDGLWDFALRAEHMDADGIAAEVLHIQGAAPFGLYPAVSVPNGPMAFRPTPEQLVAGCRAYNRWLVDRCEPAPERFLGVARLPLPDVAASVAEVEFAAKAGLRGGVAIPTSGRGDMPFYNDPLYEPLWAACAEHGMTINVHGGANVDYGNGVERLALVLAETDWLSRRAVAHMIFAGVFERYPGLHVALTEQRTQWIETTLRDWDSVYRFAGNARLRDALPKLPSEYFAGNCFIGASFMSRPECRMRGAFGTERFMWGSDYPHEEGVWPFTRKAMQWTFGQDVPVDDLRNMLGLNAARCYRLDPDELQPVADRIGPTVEEIREPLGDDVDVSRGGGRLTSWAFRTEGAWH